MISFIVPAHNEERLLGATLKSIHTAARAVCEPYEIVVADDGSTDRTAQVALEHEAVVVRVEHRQISATRNSGANVARGSLLVFVDADTQITSQAVAAAFDAVRHGAVGGGAPIRFDGVVPLYARLILPLLTLSFRLSGTAAGCFMFCTREDFDAVGGFDEAYFGAEEVVMSRALRTHGRFVVLAAPVVTSGRKLRAYSARELFTSMLRLAVGGRKAV
jgi:glycosyltransferase involved in cell wall biosynthesis